MTRLLLGATTLALLALLASCGHPRVVTAGAALDEEALPRCPMSVPGTRLAAEDAPGGERLTFTTGDEVAELQERVQAMAEWHNLRHTPVRGRRVEPPGEPARPRTRWDGARMPPSYATVEEVQDGAILQVTADDPDDVAQLQYALRLRAWRLQHQGCGPVRPPRGS